MCSARSQESWSMIFPRRCRKHNPLASWKLRNLSVTITFWKPLFFSFSHFYPPVTSRVLLPSIPEGIAISLPAPTFPPKRSQLPLSFSLSTSQNWWKAQSFPGGSDSKASARNLGDPGSIPGSGRSPGEGNGNPLQYSCLKNSTDWGAW